MPSIPSSHSRVDGVRRIVTTDRRTQRHRTTLDKIRQVEELQLFTFNPSVHQGSIKASTSGLELTNFAFLEAFGTAADAGAIRLANNTFIEWRNTGDSANIGFGVNASDNFFIDTLLDMNGQAIDNVFDISDSDANPAATGFLRLGNGVAIKWRNQANNADLGILIGSDNLLITDVGFNMNSQLIDNVFDITDSGANPAIAGFIRISNNISINWRNAANDADLGIKLNASDQFEIEGFVHHPMLLVRKTANQTVNNSSTLVNDNHLSFSVAANEIWVLELTIFYQTTSVADIKVGITMPSGATYRMGQHTLDASGGGTTQEHVDAFSDPDTGIAAYTAGGAGLTTEVTAFYHYLIVISSTAGTIQIKWAQNAAEVSDTIMLKDSYLKAFRI